MMAGTSGMGPGVRPWRVPHPAGQRAAAGAGGLRAAEKGLRGREAQAQTAVQVG